MRLRKVSFVGLVVAVSLLAQTGVASATHLDPPWEAGGVAMYDGGGRYLAQGVYARSRMYAKPAGLDGDWVNSLRAKKDTGDFVECGWYWRPGKTTRTWFVAQKTGEYYEEYVLTDVPVYATDSWIGIHVRRNNIYNDEYNIYIDGMIKAGCLYTDMTSCRAHVSSERYDTTDANKGAWRYVQCMRLVDGKYFQWVYWPNAIGWVAPEWDPGYFFYYNYVDRSDHYVYNDNHMN